MELQRSPGAKVKLTLEIEAEAPSGFNDADVGVVRDNNEAAEVHPGVDRVLGLTSRSCALARGRGAPPIPSQKESEWQLLTAVCGGLLNRHAVGNFATSHSRCANRICCAPHRVRVQMRITCRRRGLRFSTE
jgi:hypothetical protein